MAEPTTTIATASLISIGALSIFFPGINEPILLAAFCGSVVFVLSSQEISTWRKNIYMLMSFCIGLWGAATTASLIAGLLNILPFKKELLVSDTIGALFCSSVIVHILLFATKIDWAGVIHLAKKD